MAEAPMAAPHAAQVHAGSRRPWGLNEHLPECDSDVEVDLIRSINFASEEEHEQVEADAVRKHKCVTTGFQSWSQVCRQMHSITRNLPFEYWDSYRLWLLTKPVRPGEREIHVEDLPKTLCEGRGYLPKGLTIPYPSGPHWHRANRAGTFACLCRYHMDWDHRHSALRQWKLDVKKEMDDGYCGCPIPETSQALRSHFCCDRKGSRSIHYSID